MQPLSLRPQPNFQSISLKNKSDVKMERSRYFTALQLVLASVTCITITSLGIAHSEATNLGLPNKALTPGAIDPRVTQSNIRSTICVIGYTRTVRPPVSYTSPLKRSQLNSGYNVGGDTSLRDYEEDHLVPLEVGGSPSNVKNLWPEPRFGTYNAAMKDQLENKIHLLVCSGRISLAVGQRAFMENWVVAYKKYVG
jgi:hypothetical protein